MFTTHPVVDGAGLQTATLMLKPAGDGTYTGTVYRTPTSPVGTAATFPLDDMEILAAGIYDADGTLIREVPESEWR